MVEKLVLRNSSKKDEKLLLDWRNNFETRKNSFNNKIISKSEHSKWFANIISNKKFKAIIGELNKKPFGVVIFEVISSSAFVSINLAPEKRGLGLGSMLLNRACLNFSEESNVILRAKINKDNYKSLECFKKASFTPNKITSNIVYLENKICLIGAIEKIRSKNNVNWMNLMRLAFSVAPNEAKKIIRKIDDDDKKISKLLKILGK